VVPGQLTAQSSIQWAQLLVRPAMWGGVALHLVMRAKAPSILAGPRLHLPLVAPPSQRLPSLPGQACIPRVQQLDLTTQPQLQDLLQLQAVVLQGCLVFAPQALLGRHNLWGRAAQRGRCSSSSSSMCSSRGVALSHHPLRLVLVVELQCTWATEVRVQQVVLAACCRRPRL